MLRWLVVLFVLVNCGLYLWLRSDPDALQTDREPQRLSRQVVPDSIQVLPDLPGGGSRGPAAPASAARADAASAPQSAASAASATTAATAATADNAASAIAMPVALRTADTATDPACAESTALDDTQAGALRQLLAKAGVPASALGERRQTQAATWAVYMGRFSDARALQEKVDQLKRLNIAFERVTTPAALSPGLTLGRFASANEAQRRLDDLNRHGVHTARVAPFTPATTLHFLQVRSADPAWRKAVGTQRFDACTAAAPTQL